MRLTSKNYYGNKANTEYLSVSQYKDFYGTLAYRGCEACAFEKLNGRYEQKPNTAMLIGGYVDSYVEGTLDEFKGKNPEIFNSRTGELKADFKLADRIIERIERDVKFMQYLSGEKQKIMTGELFGAMWKIKIDSYIKNKAIVDLKVVKNIYDSVYVKDLGRLNFIQAGGYDFQLAVYQKIAAANTGKLLPCYIAAVDKTEPFNLELIQITQNELDGALIGVPYGVERIKRIKSGEVEPERCGRCDYCKETKVITRPITMAELGVGG